MSDFRAAFFFGVLSSRLVMNKRILQRIRVPLGFLFAAVFIIFAQPGIASMAVGAGIAALGALIRGWASGHIRKSRELAVSGPYAYTRNPLYFGSLILGIGFTVAAGVWWLGLLLAGVFAGIYFPVMRVEEEDLRAAFGTDFEEFRQNVPLFFPQPRAWKKSAAGFDFGLYLKYREYRVILGALAVMGFLAAKMWYFSWQ